MLNALVRVRAPLDGVFSASHRISNVDFGFRFLMGIHRLAERTPSNGEFRPGFLISIQMVAGANSCHGPSAIGTADIVARDFNP